MAWCFELSAVPGGQFVWNLKTESGDVVLTSEPCKKHEGAVNGIASAKRLAADPKHFEQMMSKDGQFYFSIKAANGQTLCKSSRFKTRRSCDEAIKSSMKNAPLAAFNDLT